jgi:hypothetical protein
MDDLASRTRKQFRNLLDAVAADGDGMGLGYNELGPCVGDDGATTTAMISADKMCLGPHVDDAWVRTLEPAAR